MCSQYNCPWCVLSAFLVFLASSAGAIVIWIMLAAQQEQMRICGDIHGVDLNIAFQNSTLLEGHYLLLSLRRFVCSTIPFHTKNVSPKVNTSTCLSCSISVEKYQCLDLQDQCCWMTPSMLIRTWRLFHGPVKEKNYIFMGDFVDRGRPAKVEAFDKKSSLLIPGFDFQDTTVSKLLSF